MATTKAQRWGILTILIVMVVGTVGSFAVMILSSKSQSKSAAEYQAAMTKYQAAAKEYEKKTTEQGNQLSGKYYDSFSPYASRVGVFDMASVKELSTEDIVVGSGEEVSGTTKFAAYYIGWDAKGHVFDQSIDAAANKLKSPLPINGLDGASLIKGWIEGMKGMKVGGVRQLTIPSDKAYGEQGSKDKDGKETIAPNMPLRFIVMAIPAPEAIPQPDASEVMRLGQEGGQY